MAAVGRRALHKCIYVLSRTKKACCVFFRFHGSTFYESYGVFSPGGGIFVLGLILILKKLFGHYSTELCCSLFDPNDDKNVCVHDLSA